MARADANIGAVSLPRGLAFAMLAALIALTAVLATHADLAGGQGQEVQLDARRAQIRVLEAGLIQVDSQTAEAADAYAQADGRVRMLESRIADNGRQQAIARRNFGIARQRLSHRLVEIYAQRPPSMVELLVSSGSLTSAVDSYDMVRRIADNDRDLMTGFAQARSRLSELRIQLIGDRQDATTTREQVRRRLGDLRALAGERRRLLGAAQASLAHLQAASVQRQALRAQQQRAAVASRPDSTPRQVAESSGLLPQTTSGTSAAPSGSGPTGSVAAHLASIAQCESGGNPRAVSPGGDFRGKYQFSPATWAAVGGSGDPAAAPESEQDMRAAILYERAGPGSWPVCSAG